MLNFVRPIDRDDFADCAFVRAELCRNWADVGVWSVGRRYQADELPGFIAVIDESGGTGVSPVQKAAGETPAPPDFSRIGLVTYFIEPGNYQAEIVTLSSTRENKGVGAALLDAAVNAIRTAGCVRAFLRTTNDNLRALGFYQKRGWKLAHLHKGCVEEARKRVPIIPRIGMHGIEIRDEIELELWLLVGTTEDT